jgi:hypothetical protein
MHKLTDLPSTGCEKRSRFSAACNASRRRQSARAALGRVGAECASVFARLFECHAADGKDCVNDFETAKLRCGAQACVQPDRTQDASELLQTIQ